MPHIIGKGQEEEELERYEQKVEERVKKGLEEKLGKLEAERSDIDNKDILENGRTNVRRTS